MVTLFPETQAFAEQRSDAQAALSVSNLTKRFGDEVVLDNVSFAVEEGESLVLLGPSGSGKSTTLRLIAGLETPDFGQINIRGNRIEELRAKDRNVGVIFQHYALFPRMTVAENIGFGLKIRGTRAKAREPIIAEMLELIGLADQRSKYPWQISGGQQQRVAIARALAYNPAVLLFDESFSALDPKTRVPLRREIRALLRKIKVPALFITHDQEEAMELGDHIAILNHGKLEQVGTPDEIYNDPQTEFVATFLGAANVLSGNWRDGMIHLESDCYLKPNHTVPLLEDGERVKVIFRPEDVSLTSPSGLVETPYHLGRGEVTDIGFTGASETLSVKLITHSQTGRLLSPFSKTGREALPSIKDAGKESRPGEFTINVLRTKWESLKLRLHIGDLVSVGLRTYKAICA